MKLDDYITIMKAAQFLGVSYFTLRHWDTTGKFKAVRHPLNKRRMYRKEDLEKLLEEINSTKSEK